MSKNIAHISSISSLILDLPPSCTEFCPGNSEYFVVGTYHLEKAKQNTDSEEKPESSNEVVELLNSEAKSQQRNGSLVLFKLVGDEIQLLQTLSTNFAILDLHFKLHPHGQGNKLHSETFCTANSTGSITTYGLTLESEEYKIQENEVSQLWDKSILVLSFSWHPSNPNLLGATLSTGEVVLCQFFTDDNRVVALATVGMHDLEAWTLNFDLQGTSCFSGGDDAVLQRVELTDLISHMSEERGATEDVEEHGEAQPLWKNRKLHGAGVTAILPLTENIILTGSYDDHARLIDIAKRPICLAEENLGGGVWRLKLISNISSSTSAKVRVEETQYNVLASCMHAGARILRISLGGNPRISVLASFEEHQSMSYGSDVLPRNMEEYTIISTSFYDKLLCLWRFKP